MNPEITYKHIEIMSRPAQSNVIEGRVCFCFSHGTLYNFSYVSNSEAECLSQLNRHIKELGEKLGQLS